MFIYPIFKYNGNAKYLTKDLKGGYTVNNLSALEVYLNEKELSVKIQLQNVFKDHYVVAYLRPTAMGYDR